MLYDKRWDRNLVVVREIPTRENCIVWLEGKPADEVYLAHIPSMCLIGQYHEYLGLPYPVSLDGWMAVVALLLPHTFGGALARARCWRVGHAV